MLPRGKTCHTCKNNLKVEVALEASKPPTLTQKGK
jgi:hypothetical protein